MKSSYRWSHDLLCPRKGVGLEACDIGGRWVRLGCALLGITTPLSSVHTLLCMSHCYISDHESNSRNTSHYKLHISAYSPLKSKLNSVDATGLIHSRHSTTVLRPPLCCASLSALAINILLLLYNRV